MLIGAMDKPSQKLNLIDQIQRLGIAYHFEIEIYQQLEQIHKSYFELHDGDNDNDLHTNALLFRLLRQQGYAISCGMQCSNSRWSISQPNYVADINLTVHLIY